MCFLCPPLCQEPKPESAATPIELTLNTFIKRKVTFLKKEKSPASEDEVRSWSTDTEFDDIGHHSIEGGGKRENLEKKISDGHFICEMFGKDVLCCWHLQRHFSIAVSLFKNNETANKISFYNPTLQFGKTVQTFK